MIEIVHGEGRDFRKEIMQEAEEKNCIRSATLELLDFCNFKCPYCYVKESYKSFIPKANALQILRQLKAEGCIWLVLTGGEPLLHPNFIDIYLYAFELGFRISVFTNGSLVTKQLCELFQKYPPEVVEITLYGHNTETYDHFVAVEGAFDKFDRNIDMLCQHNIKTTLKFTLTAENIAYVGKLKEYCSKKRLEYRYDDMVIPRVDGNNGACLNLRLSPQVAHQGMMARRQYVQKLASTSLDEQVVDNRIYTCGAGKNSIVIDANLRMYACILERRFGFDLSKEGTKIKEGQKYILQKMEGYLDETAPCFNCKYKPFCRYCPARFALEVGNAQMPPSWYCKYGKIVYKTIKSLKR